MGAVTTERPAASPARASYRPDGSGHSFDEEIERLRSQVALSWPVEQRRLATLGLTDGQRVLELGCGPGFVTERLARWLPASCIVALDTDRKMLDLARTVMNHGATGTRVALLQASAEATGLRAHSVDAAISRYLFQHLRDPVVAAAEIRRVLRPGGFHVIIDVDDGLWGLAEPGFPEFTAWHRVRAAAQRGRGGDRFRGRHLGRILRAAGYVNVELDVFAYHSDTGGVEAFGRQLHPDQFLPLVEEGLLTLEEFVRAHALHHRFLQSPEAFLVAVGFIAYGEAAR
jgi:SAM-dependent methyltransferase